MVVGVGEKGCMTYTESTSSFKTNDEITGAVPEVYCTSKLSPKRLAKKNKEFPTVVTSYRDNPQFWYKEFAGNT